jgi:hypothetical protein
MPLFFNKLTAFKQQVACFELLDGFDPNLTTPPYCFQQVDGFVRTFSRARPPS